MARKRNSHSSLSSWGFIRRKLFRQPPTAAASRGRNGNDNYKVVDGNFGRESKDDVALGSFLSREDIAAIAIQSSFRRHLARRAYRALRSLVKLQALVRGVVVRRQARIALQCMHALARLQITVRARQLRLLHS